MYVAPLLLVWLAFSGVLANDLAWDDIQAFKNSARYQNTDLIWRVFIEPLVFWNNYYRPVVSSSFAIQNALFGIDAKGLHLFSLLVHLFNTLLIVVVSAKLVRRWTSRSHNYWPMFVGVFYGLHPVMIEPVAFASARFDLMVTMFVLLFLLTTLTIRRTVLLSGVASALFLLAVLSKEMVFGFALALPLWLLAIDDRFPDSLRNAVFRLKTTRNLSVLAGVVAATVIYLVLRRHALGDVLVTSQLSEQWSLPARALLAVRSTFEYLALVVFPFGRINPAHPLSLPIAVTEGRNIAALISIPLVIFALLLLGRKHLCLAFFLAMSLLSLVPVLGLVPIPHPKDIYFSEYFLALPMVFFALALIPAAQALEQSSLWKVRDYRLVVYSVLGFWFLLSFFTILTTIPLWKNDEILWSWASAKNPTLEAPRINLAGAYLNSGKTGLALKSIDVSLQANRNNPVAWNIKGNIQDELGDHQAALNSHRNAVTLLPSRTQYWIDLSITLARMGRLKEAKAILIEEALPRDPGNWVANAHLGFVLKDLGENKPALVHLRRALPLAPIGLQKQRIQDAIRTIETKKAD